MGCGKSKPAVATGNTISRSKRSSNTDHAKKTKDIETIPEKTTNNTNTNTDTNTQVETKNAKVEEDSNSSIQPKQEIENAEKGSEIGNIIVKVVADKEDVKLNADSKEGDGNEEKDKKKQGELISGGADSPESSFFSTRGDGETIEAVISEGMSGTSEYYSPRCRDGVVEESEKVDTVVEEKGVVQETKSEMETKNEKPKNMNVENLIEEVRVVPKVEEPKDTATVGQAETPSAAKELHVTEDSSAKDPKTD